MFLGVDHKFPRLTPPLQPKYVAENIISILDSGRGQDLKLPYYSNLAAFIRIIPREFADMVREVKFSFLINCKISGANSDMKKFKYSASAAKAE